MFQLKLQVSTSTTPAGQVAVVTDVTDWSQAVSVRGTWAIFLAGTKLGSIQTQDSELDPPSYEPHWFQSGTNPQGTVHVPLPGNGVFRLQAVAVPVLLTQAEQNFSTSGRLYYRKDLGQFVYKVSDAVSRPVTTWADVLLASATDNASESADPRNLLDKSAEGYAYGDFTIQAALGKLNLKYLEASSRWRTVLKLYYEQAALHASGAERQFKLGFYADAATTLTATEHLLGACLPEFAQSLPAIKTTACGCD